MASQIGQKAEYSKNKALDKEYYIDLIKKSIKQHGHLERKDVDELLWTKLPEWMDDYQKKIKVNNLLSEMSKKGQIKNEDNDTKPQWKLNKDK